MKSQTLKLVKKAFLMLATIGILSCTKKDDDAPATDSLDYTVNCTYKIGATQYSGKASYLYIPINSAPDGCDKSSFQITRAGSQDLIVIGSLKREGGIFDSPNRTADTKCNKMHMDAMATFSGTFNNYQSVNSSANTLVLNGKTYTATCKVYYNNTNLASDSAIVTATWTKP